MDVELSLTSKTMTYIKVHKYAGQPYDFQTQTET